MPENLTKLHRDGIDETLIPRPGYRECQITLAAREGDPLAMFNALRESAAARGGQICQQFVLGGTRFAPLAMRQAGPVDWPITWLQGDSCSGENLTACQATAVLDVAVRPVTLGGRVVGKVFDTPAATVCRIGNILPDDVTAPRPEQARQMFVNLKAAIESAGLAWTDTVRTWLYLSRLLDWYGEFNAVRTRFFEQTGIFDAMVPASTGIGASNPAGAALVADALAIRPKNGAVSAKVVASPLQCPALDYRSSFSRAVEVSWPNGRELIVSGTASIDPQGRSVHRDDPGGQIELTVRVVEAILQSRRMSWADVTRGIAYFTDIRHAPLFERHCRQRNLPRLPLALSHATVCREDLLFEIELDAFSPTPAD